MVEVELENIEDFIRKRIDEQFSKIKKLTKKLIANIRNNLISIKVCVDHFQEAKEKIDQKSVRSLQLFSDRIKKDIDEINIPEEVFLYSNLNDLINSIKKLFTSINEIARKSLPKFQKEVQSEIKELNYLTRKLGKKQVILDQFMRKKYSEVKTAEDLLKKIPKFFTLKENIENVKVELDKFEDEYDKRNETLDDLKQKLIELENHELFKKIEVERDRLFKLRLKISDQLGFKKALKKLKVDLEKGTIHISNFDQNYLKDFLKNPIGILSKERKDLPDFSSLLIKLRRTLEENKLNLKKDKKDKTIEQINLIFDEKELHEDIEKLKINDTSIKEFEDKIKEAGLAKKLEDIKNKISLNTIKFENVRNDLERKNKIFTQYLNALKKDRENFQNQILDVLLKVVKINISFSF